MRAHRHADTPPCPLLITHETAVHEWQLRAPHACLTHPGAGAVLTFSQPEGLLASAGRPRVPNCHTAARARGWMGALSARRNVCALAPSLSGRRMHFLEAFRPRVETLFFSVTL